MAERHVQIAKNLVKKTIEDRKDLHLALLQLRNVPLFGNFSPAEILLSRSIRNPLLPTCVNKLKPHLIESTKFKNHLRECQKKQTFHFNNRKGAKPLSQLTPNTKVWVQLKPQSIWQPGFVLDRIGFRRYKVLVENRGIYVRNRKFLRPASNSLKMNVNNNNNDTLNSSKKVSFENFERMKEVENYNDHVSHSCQKLEPLKSLTGISRDNFTENKIVTRKGRVIKKPDLFVCT